MLTVLPAGTRGRISPVSVTGASWLWPNQLKGFKRLSAMRAHPDNVSKTAEQRNILRNMDALRITVAHA
jgi:hypothetical protein